MAIISFVNFNFMEIPYEKWLESEWNSLQNYSGRVFFSKQEHSLSMLETIKEIPPDIEC